MSLLVASSFVSVLFLSQFVYAHDQNWEIFLYESGEAINISRTPTYDDLNPQINSSGKVVSNWQMATDTGDLFGPVLTVSITLPGAAATSTTTASGCNNATLVNDVTIPDGTELKPGERFTKTWEILNSGTCDWNENYKIAFVGGDLFGSDTTKIRKFVAAGNNTKISLSMVAPSGSGSVTSSWQMADDNGNLFGQVFTIEIVLK